MSFSASWGNVWIVASIMLSAVCLVFVVLTAYGKGAFSTASRLLYLGTGVCMLVSLILLAYYFVNYDYRFIYVYDNSSRDLSLPYRIAALWAGKEGSFLLWLFFLNISGIFIAFIKERNTPIVFSIVILTQIVILAVLIIESPFVYVWDKHPEIFKPGIFPENGLGLNPLLKDPWMVVHPPVLFMGYSTALIPFAYACAGLLQKDRTWIERSYAWLIFSMVFLGVGIFLGGFWAYKVLGWGGYWGWDSVENSSLIPWLIAIALAHGFIIQKRTGMLVKTNLFLALFYFLLVVFSTWLTRSGVLANFSVHSFSASKVSPFLLFFFLMYFISSFVLYIKQFKNMTFDAVSARIMDWRTLAVYGIIVMVLYAMIIMVGTLLPLFSAIFTERASSATTDYYNNFSAPFGLLVIVLMILSTALLASKKLLKTENAVLGFVAVALGAGINMGHTKSPIAYIVAAASFFLVARSIADMAGSKSFSVIPSRLAHLGIGLLTAGIITSNFHTITIQKKLTQGKQYDIERVLVTFLGFREGKESSLKFSIRSNSSTRVAETAYYIDEKMQSLYREPYIISGFFYDTYLVPEVYESGTDAATQLILSKGEEREISGIKVRFIGFKTEHMTSGEPVTYAELSVNGGKLAPGMQFKKGSVIHIDRAIPLTDRSVSLREIDATSKKIALFISPGKSTKIPPDTVLLTLTKKRFIWLVWAGALFISIGGCFAFGRALAGKKA